MFIITLKTILNDKVGYQFCQVIQWFWLQQKVVLDTKYEIQNKLRILLSARDPMKKANNPHRVAATRLKTTALESCGGSLRTHNTVPVWV